MITFSLADGSGIRFSPGKKSFVVFPGEKFPPKENEIAVYGNPQEEPAAHTISWPGEYDIDGVSIRGVTHDEGKQVSYSVEADGIRCAFLSSPLHEMGDHELEQMGNVDVLVVPGDDPKLIQKLVDDIDPRILIPLPTDAKKFPEVLKACGGQSVEPVSEYKLKSLPQEGREVVVLT